MRRFNAILLLLVGMARPPNAEAKKKAKIAAATAAKVAVPDKVPVVDLFNTTAKELRHVSPGCSRLVRPRYATASLELAFDQPNQHD